MRILIMEDGGMEYLIMIILLITLLFEVYKQILFKGIPQKKPGQLMHITATVSQTILVIIQPKDLPEDLKPEDKHVRANSYRYQSGLVIWCICRNRYRRH